MAAMSTGYHQTGELPPTCVHNVPTYTQKEVGVSNLWPKVVRLATGEQAI